MTDSTNSSVQIDSSMQTYMEHLAKLSESADEAANGLRKVFLWLKTRNSDLDHIEITYDGCGDSGQIEDICCWAVNPETEIPFSRKNLELDGMSEPLPDAFFDGAPQQHQAHSFNPVTRTFECGKTKNCNPEQLLDQLAWDLAYGKNPGFEINEGGCGTVRVGVSNDNPDGVTVTLSHSERIIETNDYDYEF
jgi:hypothetical protein